MHARLLPPGSGAVLGEEGHRTASLLREAPGRQDTGPGTCPLEVEGGLQAGRTDRRLWLVWPSRPVAGALCSQCLTGLSPQQDVLIGG